MSTWQKNRNGTHQRRSRTDRAVVYNITSFGKQATLWKGPKILSLHATVLGAMAAADQHDIDMQLARIGLKWIKEIA